MYSEAIKNEHKKKTDQEEKTGMFLWYFKLCIPFAGLRSEEAEYRETSRDTEDLPEKLQAEIETKKKEPMMMAYSDDGWTYLVRGYGTQDKTGYSVSVTGCYEEEQSLCVETELLGPKRDEEI